MVFLRPPLNRREKIVLCFSYIPFVEHAPPSRRQIGYHPIVCEPNLRKQIFVIILGRNIHPFRVSTLGPLDQISAQISSR